MSNSLAVVDLDGYVYGQTRFLHRTVCESMENHTRELTVTMDSGDHGYISIEEWAPGTVDSEEQDAERHLGVFPEALGELIVALTNAYNKLCYVPHAEVQAVMERDGCTFNEAEVHAYQDFCCHRENADD